MKTSKLSIGTPGYPRSGGFGLSGEFSALAKSFGTRVRVAPPKVVAPINAEQIAVDVRLGMPTDLPYAVPPSLCERSP